MKNISEDIINNLGSNGIARIAQQLNIDESTTQELIKKGAPILTKKLSLNAQSRKQSQKISQALDDHDGSAFDKLDEVVGGSHGDGKKILKHVLGSKQKKVQSLLASETGVSSLQSQEALEILGPLVLGSLGKEKKKGGFDVQDIADIFLGGDSNNKKEGSSTDQYMAIATKLFDTNNNGSIMDEITSFISKLFKK